MVKTKQIKLLTKKSNTMKVLLSIILSLGVILFSHMYATSEIFWGWFDIIILFFLFPTLFHSVLFLILSNAEWKDKKDKDRIISNIVSGIVAFCMFFTYRFTIIGDFGASFDGYMFEALSLSFGITGFLTGVAWGWWTYKLSSVVYLKHDTEADKE